MSRVRHCVECPGCKIRYLISCTPYKNGAYLVATVNGHCEEYVLYCCCGRGATRWGGSEVIACEVSKAAYERGFGGPDEVVALPREPREAWSFDVSNYVNDWKALERRKNSV